MRASLLMIALIVAFGVRVCSRVQHSTTNLTTSAEKLSFTAPSSTTTPKIDFATQVKPIFQARCQPCHFDGGKVYQHLPFDKPETIIKLGTKLFTRIKDENEQRVIKEFLSQR